MKYLVRVFEVKDRYRRVNYEMYVPAFGLRGSVTDPELIEPEARRIISGDANTTAEFGIEIRNEWK